MAELSSLPSSDGNDADFFFLPIKLRMGKKDSQSAVEAVNYIRKHWPWWDKHGGGGRHIVMQSGVGMSIRQGYRMSDSDGEPKLSLPLCEISLQCLTCSTRLLQHSALFIQVFSPDKEISLDGVSTLQRRPTVLCAGDMGRTEAKIGAQAVLDKAIWLTHWGLYEDHKTARWPTVDSKWTASHRIGQVF